MYANRSSSGNAYRVHMHSKISDCVWHINDTRLWLYVSEKSWIPLSKCNVHQLRSAEQIRGHWNDFVSYSTARWNAPEQNKLNDGEGNITWVFILKAACLTIFFSTNVDGRVNDMLGRRKIRDKFYSTHITHRLYKQAYSWRHSLSRTQWVSPKFMEKKLRKFIRRMNVKEWQPKKANASIEWQSIGWHCSMAYNWAFYIIVYLDVFFIILLFL